MSLISLATAGSLNGMFLVVDTVGSSFEDDYICIRANCPMRPADGFSIRSGGFPYSAPLAC